MREAGYDRLDCMSEGAEKEDRGWGGLAGAYG